MIESILILAAGDGKRMLPLTMKTPKPLLGLSDNQNTILDRLLNQCEEYFPEIPVFVNISKMADKFISHYLNREFTRRPIFLYERDKLGPAATVVKFLDNYQTRTLVIHGDNVLSNRGFGLLANLIRTNTNQILVCHNRPKVQARSVVIVKNRKVLKVNEVSVDVNIDEDSYETVLVNSGIFVIHPHDFSDFNVMKGESISPRLINFVSDRSRLEFYVWTCWRFAVDSYETLLEARIKLS